MPEQLTIPTAKQEGRQCAWVQQGESYIRKQDDPGFCHYVAEKDGQFCQKHAIIAQMFHIDIRDGVDF